MYHPRNIPSTRADIGKALAAVRYSVESISPAKAQAMLDLLAEPLPTDVAFEDKVKVYSRSMAGLNWPLNGDPIIFDVNGRLVDGRARLLACVRAGVGFPSIVFHGVSVEATATLEAHLRRTPKDILGINGEAYPMALATAWPVIVSYLNADDRRFYRMSRRPQLGSNEIEALTERYPAVRESGRKASESGAVKVLGVSAATAAHYLMSRADSAAADRFVEILGNPALDPDSAPATLAQRMANLPRSTATYRLALAGKAWNRFREGKPIAVSGLGFKGHGSGAEAGQEAFPQFDGVDPDERIDLTNLKVRGAQSGRAAEAVVDASGEVIMETVLVTPEMCEEYLGQNGPAGGNGNRSIRRRHVEALARDMRNGVWMMNGRPLKFGRSGNLIDGQHRCSACIVSKVPFYSFVVRGLDDAVFGTYDTGERRGFSHQLKREGVKSYIMVAATIAVLRRVMENTSGQPTVSEGYAYMHAHPGLLESIRRTNRKRLYDLVTPSVSAALHYLFDRKDPAEAERFFTDLETGASLSPDDPMLQFRELLTDRARRAQYPLAEQICKIAIRTWNARRQGSKLRIQRESGYPAIV